MLKKKVFSIPENVDQFCNFIIGFRPALMIMIDINPVNCVIES